MEIEIVDVVRPSPGGGSGVGGSGGSGSGGGGRTPPNPAGNFTQAEAEQLKSCWEEQTENVLVEIEGWDPIASTTEEATWTITRLAASGIGRTRPYLLVHDEGEKVLGISVEILPDGIASMLASTVPPDTFVQVVSYSQIHESFHIGQIKRTFEEHDRLPKPYDY